MPKDVPAPVVKKRMTRRSERAALLHSPTFIVWSCITLWGIDSLEPSILLFSLKFKVQNLNVYWQRQPSTQFTDHSYVYCILATCFDLVGQSWIPLYISLKGAHSFISFITKYNNSKYNKRLFFTPRFINLNPYRTNVENRVSS